jgi:hypothetical protein
MGMIGGEFRIYENVWIYGAGESGDGDEVSEYISWIATDGEKVTISPGSAFEYNVTQIETFQIATKEGASYVPIDAGVIPVDNSTISIVDGVLSAQSMCDDINTRIDNIEANMGGGGSGVTEDQVYEIVGNVTADFVSEDRANELITNAMAGSDSAPEVHVGTDVPEDENIKIWVDPDEETEFATTAYVDEAVANASGGGSGAAEVFIFEGAGNDLTDADKAKLQELYEYVLANGKLPHEVWVKTVNGDGNIQMVRCFANANIFIISTLATTLYTYGYNCQISNGTISRISFIESQTDSPPQWRWKNGDYNEYTPGDIGSYQHIKVVGYWNNDSSHISTFDISTSNGNVFNEEMGTTYYAVGNNSGTWFNVSFYNESGYQLLMKVDNEVNTNVFKIIGCYYWG